MGKERILLLALGCVVLCVGQQAAGLAVLGHNGSANSNPAGTGDVPVYLDTSTPPIVLKGFVGDAEHILIAEYTEQSSEIVLEVVANIAGLSWTDYSVALYGADFFGAGSGILAPEINPVETGGVLGDLTIDFAVLNGSVGVASSGIIRTGEDAFLNIVFSDFVDAGESFTLTFEVGDVGVPGVVGAGENMFLLGQSPTVIPEPITVVTFGIGIFGVGATAVRRLRAKVA